MALEQPRGGESRNLARVVLTEGRHRKGQRNGAAIIGLVRQRRGKGQPLEPGRQVSDDIHSRNAALEGRTHTRAPVRELRRPRGVILRGDEPPGFQLGPDRGAIVLELRDDRALHRSFSGQQAERVGLQTHAEKGRRRSRSDEIAGIQVAKVIAECRGRGARVAHERQQVGAPEPSLPPPADAQTWQPSRIGPAAQ